MYFSVIEYCNNIRIVMQEYFFMEMKPSGKFTTQCNTRRLCTALLIFCFKLFSFRSVIELTSKSMYLIPLVEIIGGLQVDIL